MKRLFTNGKIFTSDRTNLYANALLVEDGVITWVGSGEDIPGRPDAFSGERVEVIDLGGRTVIPGFIDAHMHPVMLAEYSKQIPCMPPKIRSIADLIEAIAEAGENPAAKATDGLPDNDWICGWGYDEGKFAEHRSPNRYDLDAGCADRPVYIVRCCEHIRCVNSKALEIAGITRDTPDPPGGSIDRDETGEPTGILRENARDLVIPYMPSDTDEEIADSLVDLGKHLLSQGIVAIADMGNLHAGGNRHLYAKARAKGFRQRVAMYYMWDYFMDDPAFTITKEDMDPGSRLRIAGIKLIGDGSISGRTAWLARPYLDSDDCGMPVFSDESLERAIAFAKRTGCQIAVHSMGGRAIDRIIGRMKDEDDWTDGKSPFLRIEHVTEPSEEAMRIVAKRGFAFVSQPIFEYCEIDTYRSVLDEERLKHIYPFRTELERGVALAFSSDAPATSWADPSDPFTGIISAVERKAYDGTDMGQSERIDIESAIISYTKNAAQACGFSGLGMLAPGYSADFVVLSEDIFGDSGVASQCGDSWDASHCHPKVLETYIDGEAVYRSP